ncbi:MAG: O-antigen ligase family protein [Bacteroidales bacterium]|nr:O-antigen ligase family protein [Bacteroidales bacterium]
MKKWQKLVENPTILVFIMLFVVHLVWLLNSQNIDYGIHDIKIKLPLLALPVIIGTSKVLNKKQIDIIVAVFIFGVLISTLTGLIIYFGFVQNPNTDNVRNISYFVSHIRLSLMVCLSVLLVFRFINERKFFTSYKIIIAIVIILWFVGFLMMIQGFTGLISLLIVGIISLGVKAWSEKNKFKRSLYFTVVAGLPILIISYLAIQINSFYTPSNTAVEIKEFTENGNKYYHNLESGLLENGNLIYVNICEKELYSEWNKRSNLNLDGADIRQQSLLHTLIRYLTSLGFSKDASSIAQLSDRDILNIENGNTNYRFVNKNNVSKRIYNIIWQIDVYTKGGNPSGHSITQRFEYLKAGLILSYRNIFCGTGTGDVDDEYKALYIEKMSQLDSQYRHRAHNQFLTFFVSFGVIGAFLCFFAFFYPVIMEFKFANYHFAVFILIAVLSMLTDDTLETTTGVVFVSYFYSLFLWGEK